MKNKKVVITITYLAGLFFGAGLFYSYLYKKVFSDIIRLSPAAGFSLEPYAFYIVLAVLWIFLTIVLILFNKFSNKKENKSKRDNPE